MNRIKILFLSVLVSLVLAGCGFHLRGDIDLPELYQRVYLVDQGYSDVGGPLRDALKAVGTEMVSSPAEATAVVTLLSRGINQRALAVGGKAIREYELQLDVSFVVQDAAGATLGEASTVTEIRTYRNTADEVLGKEDEASIIIGEMRQNVVRRILLRLKALAR